MIALMNTSIPTVAGVELAESIRAVIPNAQIDIATVNPKYGSWELRVTKGNWDIEFVWGPLSGFGARDMTRPTTPDDTPFDYADVIFHSVDEALEYLHKLVQKYA